MAKPKEPANPEKTADAARAVEIDVLVGLGIVKAIGAGLEKEEFQKLVDENWDMAKTRITEIVQG